MKDEDKIIARGEDLCARLASARESLYNKIVGLKIESIGISEYNQEYLKKKIPSLKAILELYSNIILLGLRNIRKSFKEAVMVDYGGGSGLISLLAAEAGSGGPRKLVKPISDESV